MAQNDKMRNGPCRRRPITGIPRFTFRHALKVPTERMLFKDHSEVSRLAALSQFICTKDCPHSRCLRRRRDDDDAKPSGTVSGEKRNLRNRGPLDRIMRMMSAKPIKWTRTVTMTMKLASANWISMASSLFVPSSAQTFIFSGWGGR